MNEFLEIGMLSLAPPLRHWDERRELPSPGAGEMVPQLGG